MYYIWNMNPKETRKPNETIFKMNQRFIPEYKVLGPTDIEPLLDFFPEIKKKWSLIPHWVIQADIARLLYIYEYGGIYLDCDCIIEKPLPEIPWVCLEKTVSVHTLGPKESTKPEHAMRIANYAFGFPKHHPFVKEALDECSRRLCLHRPVSHSDILWCCGPDVITTVYHASKEKITLLNSSYLKHLAVGSWR
jgi:mannosyltransferase OCH1-like enzyme